MIAFRLLSFAAVVVSAGVWGPRVAGEPSPLAVSPLALAQACADDKHSQVSIQNDDDDDRRTTVKWSSGDCEVELRARGRFAVKGDLSDFDSVARGGWVRLAETRGGTERRLELRNDGGRLTRAYRVNDAERPWDAEAQRWLAGLLLELERRTAFAADQRVPMLLRQGGPGAVIDEVARMRGDYASHVYFTKLFEKVPRLDAPLVKRALDVAGQRVSSDYYRTEILRALEKRGLPDDEARLAYVRAASTIGSDYYRAEALGAMLDEGDGLSRAAGDALLQAAIGIGSDYYASETLKKAVARGLVRSDNRAGFFKAVRGVKSDYYRSEILLGLLRGERIDTAGLAQALAATDGMGSDHYVTEVLLAAARKYTIEGDAKAAYVKAANGIGSDHYHRQAMSALVQQTMRQ